jgi:hypothetical protein
MEFVIWNFLPLARRSSQLVSGIEVHGTNKFIERSAESLNLLQPLAEFAVIRANIAVIRQGRRSGMKAWLAKPTFVVGKPTWSHSAIWFAGAIAHDAYHAKLYHDAKTLSGSKEPDADTWTGAAAEKKCLAFQRQFLSQINADREIIDMLLTTLVSAWNH